MSRDNLLFRPHRFYYLLQDQKLSDLADHFTSFLRSDAPPYVLMLITRKNFYDTVYRRSDSDPGMRCIVQ